MRLTREAGFCKERGGWAEEDGCVAAPDEEGVGRSVEEEWGAGCVIARVVDGKQRA